MKVIVGPASPRRSETVRYSAASRSSDLVHTSIIPRAATFSSLTVVTGSHP